jgi:hypothetical protein
MTGQEGGQGGGASPRDLKLSGMTLGAKEKVGGDKVENQELGPESLQFPTASASGSSDLSRIDGPTKVSVMMGEPICIKEESCEEKG